MVARQAAGVVFQAMPLPAELHEYAVDLAFKNGDVRRGFAEFEKFSDDCILLEDYIAMLQILAYAQGPCNKEKVFVFLERCLNSEFEDVRKNACFFTAPRFIKGSQIAKAQLLPILRRIAIEDADESVRRSAFAGLFSIGEFSEEEFKKSQGFSSP